MTPADEWDVGTDLSRLCELLAFGDGRHTHPAVRLFLAAMGRDLWPLLVDDRSRRAVEATEQHLTGRLDHSTWARVVRAADAVAGVGDPVLPGHYAAGVARLPGAPDAPWFSRLPVVALDTAAEAIRRSPQVPVACRYLRPLDGAGELLCGRLRCLLANPFRPAPAFDPGWRTPTVTALAAAALADRDHSHLPVLADALEDAGCDAAELLSHARSPGPHVFGCRAVTACLGS